MTIYRRMWKKLGCDKKINFRNESVKKPTIYDLFIIAIYSLQNVNKQSSEMKNKHQNSLFSTSTVFPGLEPILYAGQKLWLTAKFFRKLFLAVDCPTKKFKKLVEKTTRKKVENNWKKLVFLENLLF